MRGRGRHREQQHGEQGVKPSWLGMSPRVAVAICCSEGKDGGCLPVGSKLADRSKFAAPTLTGPQLRTLQITLPRTKQTKPTRVSHSATVMPLRMAWVYGGEHSLPLSTLGSAACKLGLSSACRFQYKISIAMCLSLLRTPPSLGWRQNSWERKGSN